MDGEIDGELQTTVENLTRQLAESEARLRESRAELRSAIESHPRASRGFRRKLGNIASRMRLGLLQVPSRRKRRPEKRLVRTVHTMRREEAFRGYAKSFYVRVLNIIDPMEQLRLTRDIVRHRLAIELDKNGGLKFIEILKITLMKANPPPG